MTNYRIAPHVAWLDGVDTGRTESIAWIARLDTGNLYELHDASWLVWLLLADNFSNVDLIETEVTALEATIDFGEEGLTGFLNRLHQEGLIEEIDHPAR